MGADRWRGVDLVEARFGVGDRGVWAAGIGVADHAVDVGSSTRPRAMFQASSTRLVAIVRAAFQPTMQRENTSLTNALNTGGGTTAALEDGGLLQMYYLSLTGTARGANNGPRPNLTHNRTGLAGNRPLKPGSTPMQHVLVTIYGQTCWLDVRDDETLRDRLGTTSVRAYCGICVRGTCTMLVDGIPLTSCLLLTALLEAHDVVTAEGLPGEDAAAVSRVQQGFIDAGASQCSYCTPAMALTVHGLLEREPQATVERLCAKLGGDLCRCGSYPLVREALRALVDDRLGSTQQYEGRSSR